MSNKTFISEQAVIVFRTDKKTSTEPDETYTGSLSNFDEMYEWVQEKCIPLVREITFENAEELTEEGLPFLILFHNPTDNESVKKYKEVINRELQPEKRKFYIKSMPINGLFFIDICISKHIKYVKNMTLIR